MSTTELATFLIENRTVFLAFVVVCPRGGAVRRGIRSGKRKIKRMEEQQKERRRSVCLFGLSADPPTGMEGHLGIVRALQQQGEWDEVWVLPVYRHTFSVRRVNAQCVCCSHRSTQEILSKFISR